MFTMYSLKRNKFMPLDHHMHICLIKRKMYVVYVLSMYVCMYAKAITETKRLFP